MKRQTKPDIEKIFAEGTAIDEAVNAAAREAVEQHFLAGRSVSEWRDGKVVMVPPRKTPVVRSKQARQRVRSR